MNQPPTQSSTHNVTRSQIVESLTRDVLEQKPDADEICYADLRAKGLSDWQAEDVMKRRVEAGLFTRRLYRGKAYFKPTELWLQNYQEGK